MVLVTARRVVLTRPAERQGDLAQRLMQQGCEVLDLPALSIHPLSADWCADDVRPDAFDVLVFVSRAAWDCYIAAVHDADPGFAWPSSAVLAAVGQATARCIRQDLGDTVTVLSPASDSAQDSESLWTLLEPRLTVGARVLLVRGDQGRDWLADRLRAAGVQLRLLSVYRRERAHWPFEGVVRLKAWRDDGRGSGVLLVTSLQSLQAIEEQVRHANLLGWLPSAVVVVHPRLQAPTRAWLSRLGAQGDDVPVKLTRPDDESLFECLLAVFHETIR